ncbi:MAG: hypothetical protein HQL40_15430 [Alphaproteobacteria bacterium]|nr:hypothetical protein [Alphaproteobacteria bacterium]
MLDAVIGERLGFARSRDVRSLIEGNRTKLESYGEVYAAAPKTSHKGGRPARAYYLNEGQALVICALTRTPQAAAVSRELIEAFMAWRRGPVQFQPPPPDGAKNDSMSFFANMETARADAAPEKGTGPHQRIIQCVKRLEGAQALLWFDQPGDVRRAGELVDLVAEELRDISHGVDLDERDREMVKRAMGGMRLDRIAEQFGCSARTVQRALAAARRAGYPAPSGRLHRQAGE